MSYFTSDVIAKEQLLGVSAIIPPVIPPTPSAIHGGGVVTRVPMPLSLIITLDGQVYLTVDLNKERKEGN